MTIAYNDTLFTDLRLTCDCSIPDIRCLCACISARSGVLLCPEVWPSPSYRVCPYLLSRWLTLCHRRQGEKIRIGIHNTYIHTDMQGLGIAVKLTLGGSNQFVLGGTWFFVFFCASCIIIQMNYLNKVRLYVCMSFLSIINQPLGFGYIQHSGRDAGILRALHDIYHYRISTAVQWMG